MILSLICQLELPFLPLKFFFSSFFFHNVVFSICSKLENSQMTKDTSEQKLQFQGKLFRLSLGSLEFYQLHDIGIILHLKVAGKSAQGDSCSLVLKGIFLIGVEAISQVAGKTFNLQDLHKTKNSVAELTVNNRTYPIHSATVRLGSSTDIYTLFLDGQASKEDAEDILMEFSATVQARYINP